MSVAQTKPREFDRPPPLYRLAEAVALFFPTGGITVKSLRTEARAGRLHIIKIANKDFVTAEAITAMLERCTCRVPESQPDSISAKTRAPTSHIGPSLMEREKRAQAALNTILQAHKKR